MARLVRSALAVAARVVRPVAPVASTAVRAASTAAASSPSGFLTLDTLNKNVRQAQYAVRGEIVTKALAIAKELQSGKHSRPFEKVVYCNIGNPHELKQQPITFFRQVFALVNYPQLLDDPRVGDIFPADAIARARKYVAAIPGGTGAYTNSQGLECIREDVAAFITRRDGYTALAKDIFLTDGASPGVQMLIRAMVRTPADAIMIPMPQYPLYSASLALYGGSRADYMLDEEKGWSLQPAELERSLSAAKVAGQTVRAIAVINPGNPTGNVLSASDMEAVLSFAAKHGLIILADEVYQDNVWSGSELASGRTWKSFKAAACAMGLVDPAATNVNKGVQIASFHSTSKGFTGECGRRGGFVELVGFDDDVRGELYKLASISLCSNVGGQLMTGLQCTPPQPGEPSHALYTKERDGILSSLQRRAVALVKALRGLEGVSCQAPEGALYVFPTITLPPRAVAAAAAVDRAADAYYCMRLLEATGIVLVPGSGFGQKTGTFHFRSTILPPEAEMDAVVERIRTFHAGFMKEFA